MQTFQPLYVNYPEKPELSLDGACGYRIEEAGRVNITVDSIANSRDANGVSGTLSVELWALKQPYQGDYFEGIALAGAQIGELYDQHLLNDCRYDLCFQEPPAGAWHLSLMLREWDGGQYVTRDFVNFDHPYVVSWKPVVLQGGLDANAQAPQATEAAVASTVADANQAREPANSAADTAADAGKAKSSKKSAAKAKAEVATVNLNTASVKAVASLKGVSQKVAEAIVAERPFSSLEALLKVKGMGKKLLEKLQDSISL